MKAEEDPTIVTKRGSDTGECEPGPASTPLLPGPRNAKAGHFCLPDGDATAAPGTLLRFRGGRRVQSTPRRLG